MGPRADGGAAVLAGVVLPDRYEPIRRIARGGMATVWCAKDRTLDRRVAIKLLAEPYAREELAGRRFTREARAAARLSGHPNVVTIYDVGQAPSEDGSQGRPFMVMEYMAGGTVADALRAAAVDRQTALTWLHQAAAALDYAHRRGVIHRDVKPANFLLDRDRVLHVADFGIAQLGSEDTLTVSGEVLGTAAYLAPERALGQPATEASDRYALAVAAFELLVGQRPFMADHFAAQARQHVEDAPPRASRRNPELPTALDAVLMRGMAKRPEDRFPSARGLIEGVAQALGPAAAPKSPVPRTETRAIVQPVPAVRPAAATARPVVRPGARGRHRGRIAAVTALAAALLAVAFAAALGHGPSHPQPQRAAHAALPSHRVRRKAPKRTSNQATSSPAASSAGTSSPHASTTAAPPEPASGAGALETQGHALMAAGDYRSAIPVLRQAVAAASPTSITYAYALYDLGRSLRLAGDPRAAVPILWRRLQIPNQTSVVRAELTLALEALGQRAAAPPPSSHGGDHHGAGHSGSGSGEGA